MGNAGIGRVVVQLEAHFESSSHPKFLLMEKVDETLWRSLSKGTVTPSQLLHWALDLLSAVLALADNIVHMDLAPTNIGVRAADNSACLLDFGSATTTKAGEMMCFMEPNRRRYAPE